MEYRQRGTTDDFQTSSSGFLRRRIQETLHNRMRQRSGEGVESDFPATHQGYPRPPRTIHVA